MSLTQKIWLLMTVPFVVAIVAYLAATRPFRRELLFREASRELRDDANTLQAALASGVVEADRADLAALIESVSHSERVLGVALYSSDGSFLESSKDFPDRAVADDLARRALQSKNDVSTVSETGNTDVLQHAIPLGAAGPATNGVVVVFRDIGYVDHALWDWNVKLATVGLLSAIAILVASRMLVRRLVEAPLKEVMSGVARVSEGRLESDVPARRDDELGTLARSFNEMTSKLRVARAAVEEEHARRAALETRIRHLQTLAVAGEVAASLAHEIGSPLNVILGRTRMMAARPDTSAPARQELETIGAQTERIARTVQKLLRLSRPARQILEDIDIRAAAEETITFIAPECRNRKIATSVVCDASSPPKVRADRDQITQILFNLCHNAMQAQPNGGRIDIKIARVDLNGRNGAAIEVSDAGPGIAPSVKGRIFDPFVTTKETEGGNGLGLAIVDGMVRELGGVVEADDGPEGGACFRIKLPALASEKAA
jgi:signal transduction histidine kinase